MTIVVPLFTFAERTRNDSNFSPKAVVSVRPLDWAHLSFADDFMTYFSWSKGFKSGTFQTSSTSPNRETRYDRKMVDGLRARRDSPDSSTADYARTPRSSGTTSKDLQSQFISLLSGGTTNFENAGEAHVDGAEIDLSYAVFADLIFNVGATYLDGVYDDFRNASGFDPQNRALRDRLRQQRQYDLMRTPKYTLNSGLVYNRQIWKGMVEADGRPSILQRRLLLRHAEPGEPGCVLRDQCAPRLPLRAVEPARHTSVRSAT